MDYRYRINANVGVDQVLKVNLKQGIDIYEILSLTLTQKNLYKLHSADYGLIVGRVLANDAFGVPNAKVTVFIPLSDTDELRPDIRSIYPYNFVTDQDSRNVRFNTLPNYKLSDCHQAVGSFPKKRLVLDEDSVLEIYDKYYKYSTVTNNVGDYMIFGVPTGEQIIHVDVDLSDIGILSQTPRDMIYKGYSPDLFESPTQFRTSTNLDDLPQIQSQTASVTVYPLWGDSSTSEIAITRKDVNLQYKFEPTCVFLGSVITDNGLNSIGHTCIPDENVGEASQFTASKGNIEMIRKTVDDEIEEFSIKSNQLIDGDGTWCYQIPMNLDYIGMDEYGNIIQTNSPNKGIPTRTRVRFRISLDELSEGSITRHAARYLVPNNPELYHGHLQPTIHKNKIDNDSFYEFGSLTPEECFRDLYWNKAYSVKGYVPRIQTSKHEKTSNYLAIKGVNKNNAKKYNPLPFNKLNLNISVSAYHILHSLFLGEEPKNQIGISGFWRYLRSYSAPYNVDAVRERILEEMDGIGLDFYNDWLNGCLYFPLWFWQIKEKNRNKNGKSTYDSVFCECKNNQKTEIDGQNKLYIYNNCSLAYVNEDLVFKTRDLPGDITKIEKIKNTYKFYYYLDGNEKVYINNDMYTSISLGSKNFYSGIIKKKKTINDEDVFYYSFGNKLTTDLIAANMNYNNSITASTITDDIITDGNDYYNYARLFSTDIILLGSLSDYDIDDIPKVGFDIPSTTSNIPPMGTYKKDLTTTGSSILNQSPRYDSSDMEETQVSVNGMNWGNFWDEYNNEDKTHHKYNRKDFSGYKYEYGSGLFFGLSLKDNSITFPGFSAFAFDWTLSLLFMLGAFPKEYRKDVVPVSDIKTCVNAERICELGVTLDTNVKVYINDKQYYTMPMDGLITKNEIINVDSRSLFATLNSCKLNGIVENEFTGYKKYNLPYLYPTNFDGRLETIARAYTNVESGKSTKDYRNKDYLDFRFGSNEQSFISSNKSVNYVYNNSNTNGHSYGGRRTSNADEDSATPIQNAYTVHDGYVEVTKQIIPRTRHFYGYRNGDNVWPYIDNISNMPPSGYPYAFPMYENSFYFYFGLNQGSTAIDKFYENFYSSCPKEEKEPFTVSITTTASTACDKNIGKINLVVQNAEYPYDVHLYESANEISSATSLTTDVVENRFYGLSNGDYVITINDSIGKSMSINVSLSYSRIELNFIATDISMEVTTATTCSDVGNSAGTISVNSYTNNGSTSAVTSLTNGGVDGEYIINNDNNFVLTINNTQNICGVEGNTFKIYQPSQFILNITQKCNGGASDNTSTYIVEVSDTRNPTTTNTTNS